MARIIICDRCGKQIDRGEVIGHINFWNEDNGESYAEVTSFHDWDFCPDCMGDIYAFIKTAATLDHARMMEQLAGEGDLKNLKGWREIADAPEIEPEGEAEAEPGDKEEETTGEPEVEATAEPEEMPEAEQEEAQKEEPKKRRKYTHKKVDVDTRSMTPAERAEAIARRREQEEKEAEAAGPDAAKYGYKSNKADWPKFRACLAAGKDVKWLAVEFGVTEWTVRNWKRKLKEMEEAEEAEQTK